MAEYKQRLVITNDDLVDAPPPPPPAAAGGGSGHTLPPITGVRPQPRPVAIVQQPGVAGLLRATLPASIIGALVATVLGWIPLELLTDDAAILSNGELVARTALEFGCFGAVFAAVYSAWDDVIAGVWSRVGQSAGIGFGIGLVCGAASGAIAQVLYTEIVESLFAHADDFESVFDIYNSPKFYFARAFAWAIFGLGVGAAAAAAKRSARKLVNGLIGGVAGGALGGLFFHWLSMQITSGPLGRVLGLAVVGVCIGAAIGLVEIARRQAWLRVVSGGMSGKEFIVYHQHTDIGASPKCQITLIKDPAIAPFHLRIEEHGARRVLRVFEGCAAAVNGAPVTQHTLRSNDVIQVGGTALQYAERVVG